MKGDRARKNGRKDYAEGLYRIVSRAGQTWIVIDDCIEREEAFRTLYEARKWCRENPADPERAGIRF